MDKLVKVAFPLQPSERPLRAMFHQMFQFVGSIEQNAILIKVNQTVLDFVGFTRSGVIGLPFRGTSGLTISIMKSVNGSKRGDRLFPDKSSYSLQDGDGCKSFYQLLLLVGLVE